MDSEAVGGVLKSDAGRDGSAPITTLCGISLITEPRHQLGPRLCYPLHIPSLAGRLVREAVTRKRRTHQMERVGSLTAMRGRVGQRFDYFQKLHDRSRPSVRDKQRGRVRMRRAGMNKVNSQTVDFCLELRKAIQQRLARTPVVLLQPI